MSDAPGTPEITGTIPFYKKPEPLSAEAHAGLGLKKIEQPWGFVREAHVVPVTVGEFGPVALNYPIIFSGENKMPLAVMGLRRGANLFITAAGELEDGVYLPGFIRRYPFVLAEAQDQQGFVVCVDRESELVSDNPDQPFFNGKEPTQYTNDAVEFLKGFEQQRQLTEQLSKLFMELDLFENKSVSFQPRGDDGNLQDARPLAEYFAVSIEKLNQLPADKLVELRNNGALAAIYVHNLSLINWQRILERAIRANTASPAAATV